MKRIIFIIIILLLCMRSVSKGASFDDLDIIDGAVSDSARDNISYASESFSFKEAAKEISKGSYTYDFKGVIKKTLDMLFSEVSANGKILATVVLLGVLCSFISNLSSAFGQGGVNDAAFLCSYAILAGITAAGFLEISNLAKESVSDMGLFIKSLIPVMTSLSAAEGRVIFAPLMHTQILVATGVCSIITEKVLIPLVYASFALKFINNLTSSLSLSSLAVMIDKICKRVLSFMLLIFTAMLTLTSFAAGTAENMGMKTARFAISSLVPFAGGALADSVTAITASFSMIKNSAGLAGIIGIALMAAYPVIKCAAMSILYNFTGAILEPVTERRLSLAVTSVGECMGMMFAIVSVSAAQYMISAAILLTSFKG